MTLLLDTHVLLWWLDDSPRLGARARAAIADPDNTVWVSAATAWEIAIKTGLGRLDMNEPPQEVLPREIEHGGFRPLAISMEHALAVRTLPPHHRDPFDRLLIAQAMAEDLRLVTADRAFARYGVSLIAAGE